MGAQRLSQELGIPVKALEAQWEQTGLGWGQILIVNRLAQNTGTTFDQIVNQFRNGKGWGKIAMERSLSVGTLFGEVEVSHAGIRTTIPGAGRGRGDDAGAVSGANGKQSGDHADGASTGRGWARGVAPGIPVGAGSTGPSLDGGASGGADKR